jgi:hypothetical protein
MILYSYVMNFLNTCICAHEHMLENTLESHFIYLGNKEINCIFKTSRLLCFIFYKMLSFHNFILFCSNNTRVCHKQCAKNLNTLPTRMKFKVDKTVNKNMS